MWKKILFGSLVSLMFCSGVSGKEIGAVLLPDTFQAGEDTLFLNGAGLRKRLFVKVYVGALYLRAATQDPRKIIEADEPMVVRIHIIYDGISSKDFIDALNQGFQNATGGDITPIREKIDQFTRLFRGDPKKNDLYDIVYLPGKGINVLLNSKPSGVVDGLTFKKAVFSIWLGEKPVDVGLKKGMLGK